MKYLIASVLFITLSLLVVDCNSATTKSDNRALDTGDYTYNQHDSVLSTGWYYITDSGKGINMKLDKSNDIFIINPSPIVLAKDFTSCILNSPDQGAASLVFHFNDRGIARWSIATQKAVGKRLALIIDNVLVFTPVVQSQITSGISALNRGNYSINELTGYKAIIDKEISLDDTH